jgi:hypothetical protein
VSRLYNGTTDLDTFALPTTPASGPVNFVYGTVLIVARFVSAASWASLIEVETSSTLVVAGIGRDSGGALYYADGGTLRRSNEAGTGTTFTIGTGDNWCLYAVTKPNGTTAASFHKIPIATGVRTTFTHGSTSINAVSLSNGKIMLAGNDDPANIRVAAAAVLPGVVLTTTQLDGIASAKTTASIIALAPADGWVVDDSDSINLNLVANNTNRSARSGTADDADDPSGWVYGAGGGGGSATVTGVPADATGDLANPTHSAGATVTAPPADATGDIPEDMPLSAGVTSDPADATGDLPAPTVTGTGDATITGTPADATGDLPSPALSTGSTVTAPPADATGDTPAPTTGAGATVTATPADATGDLPIPTQIGSPIVRVRTGNRTTGATEVTARLTGANEPAHSTGAAEPAHSTGAEAVLNTTGATEVALVA